MKIVKYPDGSSYADVKDQNYFNITHKINSYEDLWHLGQIIEAANHNRVKPTITIPCIIDGQADRRFNSTQSSGLKLVCKFLNSFDVLKYRIFHPHNSEVVESLINNVQIIDNSEFIKKVIYNELYPGPGFPNPDMYDNLILMSSDAGGFKPLMKLCDKIQWQGETISASKARSYNPVTSKSELTQILNVKDLQGKDVLIVDDICVYGGTFKGLAKLLRTKNCGKLYLAVSHMTVQNLGVDPVMNYFDKIFVTNSKYDKYFGSDLLEFEDLEIIKLF